ncbi:hypothetical protein QAD02_009304 [Eretmocerus hayati]|uniref:Uncharacterized protein n=1 Tax=Eretmocerus hayati TaxID=131215 RepID=A0ACC2N9A5_9HYME|nr:hypothetical protein QAD02_009304 [Eretmocerus hayati]
MLIFRKNLRIDSNFCYCCIQLRSSSFQRFYCSKAKHKQKSSNKWNAVVGLEVHAQILSNSKLFSGAGTAFGNAANSCVSLFDCAMPGTLPVLNRRCVEAGVLTALALSCRVNETSLFERKHYFYADLPAGYQITQQRQPLAVDGEISFNVFTPGVHKEPYPKSSKLKQLQLEQDSGKSLHDDSARMSLIDLNRAGIPLMELVFEPDLSDGEEAAALVKELVLILEKLNTCSCKMDEGALRVDANVSINKPNEPLGVRTELKNIGSVRGVASAVNYEISRQIKIRENGDQIVNETRAWDVETGRTVAMREKEDKFDYRFMPEPNLPPLLVHIDIGTTNVHNLVDATTLKSQIPKLPQAIRDELLEQYGVSRALVLVLVNEPKLLSLFRHIIEKNSKLSPQFVAKILCYQFMEFIHKNDLNIDFGLSISDHLEEAIDLLQSEKMNLLVFHKVLKEIQDNPEKFPTEIIEKENWTQITDEEELKKICQSVLDEYPDLVKKYRGGKKTLLKYFMKKIVEKTDQRANMKHAQKLIEKMLE